MTKTDVQIVVPIGMFGTSKYDTILDLVLRSIAEAISHNPQAWVGKYGSDFENDVFMMHPYCWCEDIVCLWCSGCLCPNDSPEYYLDGQKIEDWSAANDSIVAPLPHTVAEHGTSEYKAAKVLFDASILERDYRLKTIYSARIHACEPKGLMENRERGESYRPSQTAPNFWHKTSGLKVWWYKYIGRDVETNIIVTDELLNRIQQECLLSL